MTLTELDADRQVGHGLEALVRELQQQARLSDARVTNNDVCGGRSPGGAGTAKGEAARWRCRVRATAAQRDAHLNKYAYAMAISRRQGGQLVHLSI